MSTSKRHLCIPNLNIKKYEDFIFLLELNFRKTTIKTLPNLDIRKIPMHTKSGYSEVRGFHVFFFQNLTSEKQFE